MRKRQFSVTDYFEQVVRKTSQKLLGDLQAFDSGITGVHYEHGHPVEIIETLMQKDRSQTLIFNKYPLVALFQDFPEKWLNEYQMEATVNIIICNSTVNTLKAKERYDRNFIPVLYPIYDELISQIEKHPNTIGYSPNHTKVDRLYWGRNGLYGNKANTFNDYLDAVELLNFKINFNTLIC